MITIRKPQCFSEIGLKDNQEDYLFPSDATDKSRVFILCDGMGGHDNGEVASRTAAETLGEYLTSCREVDTEVFLAALGKAYDALDAIDTGSDRKPGTTMTCLCLNDDSYLVAHIGDSRIYHLRPSLYDPSTGRGGIIYQSSDHSLVNDLLKAGEITEEEARDFPRKNVITRAMQPHLEQRYKADVYEFDDIRSGDYFFLCCDGILEQLSNETLCKIIADRSLDDGQKLSAIKAVCDGRTRDNYTCWLIPIDKASVNGHGAKRQGVITPEVEDRDNVVTASVRSHSDPVTHQKRSVTVADSQSKSHDRRSFFLSTVAAAGVAAAVVWFGLNLFRGDEPKDIIEVQTPPDASSVDEEPVRAPKPVERKSVTRRPPAPTEASLKSQSAKEIELESPESKESVTVNVTTAAPGGPEAPQEARTPEPSNVPAQNPTPAPNPAQTPAQNPTPAPARNPAQPPARNTDSDPTKDPVKNSVTTPAREQDKESDRNQKKNTDKKIKDEINKAKPDTTKKG